MKPAFKNPPNSSYVNRRLTLTPFSPRTRIGLLICATAFSVIFGLWRFLSDSSFAKTLTEKTVGKMEVENNVFKSANLLASAVPDNVLKLRDSVEVKENRIMAKGRKIFYREALPPQGNFAKGEILMLHGQAFTSANWLEKQTIETFAAAGYRTVAVDLPGYGQTGGNSLSQEEKPALIDGVITALEMNKPVLVSPSMSGSYSMPFFMRHTSKLRAFIPVAPVSTNDYTSQEYEKNQLPTLIVYGDRDTSLGILSASNLKNLSNGRVMKIPNAGHACYLNNPEVFHLACLNFLDLVRTYAR